MVYPMKSLTKNQKRACKMFSDACVDEFHIRPEDDDNLILQSALRFQEFIGGFTSLNVDTDWHRNFVEVKIKYALKGLYETMREKYGSYEEYSYRSSRQYQESRKASKAKSL
jgi:hypothetical protein